MAFFMAIGCVKFARYIHVYCGKIYNRYILFGMISRHEAKLVSN